MTRARSVSQPSGILTAATDIAPKRVSHGRGTNDNSRDRSPRQGAPVNTDPHSASKKKESQCGAIVAQPCDTDIAASATERWDTRYRNRHGRQGAAHRPSHQAGNTGSPDPYWTASGEPQDGSRFYPGDARPERYQGRVAQLTHNAALASSGRRAPHRTSQPFIPLVGTNGWVLAQERRKRRDDERTCCCSSRDSSQVLQPHQNREVFSTGRSLVCSSE